jgi:charged multivesicular body protein 2B
LFKSLVNDTLDDILNESGDEEEGDAIVNQVLDEIGIEISGKVSDTHKSVFPLSGELEKGQAGHITAIRVPQPVR